jgi:hypothetical protein
LREGDQEVVSARRSLAVAIVLALPVAAAGCGLGPGSSIGEVELTVTRDYGAERLVRETERSVPESETVMRLLDRNAEIETRYGGRFVQSVNGIEGGRPGGRSHDWFFYVNGVESPVGAADYHLHGGDRVWWDYRDWTEAMRVPAVVGLFPEPFLHGYEGDRHPVEIVCAVGGSRGACRSARSRLDEVGAARDGQGEPIEVLVGAWGTLESTDAAALIERGPQSGGVFADFESVRGTKVLELLDVRGDPGRTLRSGAGLVAATRDGDKPPTWVVTGTDAAGVAAAVRLLTESRLRDHYAVAVSGSRSIPVPVP